MVGSCSQTLVPGISGAATGGQGGAASAANSSIATGGNIRFWQHVNGNCIYRKTIVAIGDCDLIGGGLGRVDDLRLTGAQAIVPEVAATAGGGDGGGVAFTDGLR